MSRAVGWRSANESFGVVWVMVSSLFEWVLAQGSKCRALGSPARAIVTECYLSLWELTTALILPAFSGPLSPATAAVAAASAEILQELEYAAKARKHPGMLAQPRHVTHNAGATNGDRAMTRNRRLTPPPPNKHLADFGAATTEGLRAMRERTGWTERRASSSASTKAGHVVRTRQSRSSRPKKSASREHLRQSAHPSRPGLLPDTPATTDTRDSTSKAAGTSPEGTRVRDFCEELARLAG